MKHHSNMPIKRQGPEPLGLEFNIIA